MLRTCVADTALWVSEVAARVLGAVECRRAGQPAARGEPCRSLANAQQRKVERCAKRERAREGDKERAAGFARVVDPSGGKRMRLGLEQRQGGISIQQAGEREAAHLFKQTIQVRCTHARSAPIVG